jgi:hypothetical protein
MKYVTANCGVVAVGLAFGPIVPEFVSELFEGDFDVVD